MEKCFNKMPVVRVSSHPIRSAVCKESMPLGDRSRRFPIGVATSNKVPNNVLNDDGCRSI